MPSGVNSKRKQGKRRGEVRRRGLSGALRILGVSALFGAILFSLALGLKQIGKSDFFRIREIEWVGLTAAREAEMQRRFQPVMGQNLFRIDIQEVKRQLLAEPWIKAVTVKKRFPDRLMIFIVPRKAAAVGYGWSGGDVRRAGLSDAPVLIAPDGVTFRGEGAPPEGLPRLVNYNAAAYPEALRLGRLLKGRADLLIDLSDPGDLRLIVTGPDGAARGIVHFGAADYPVRWRRFLAVEDDLRRRGIARFEIDLRFSGSAVVTRRDTSAEGKAGAPGDPADDAAAGPVYF